MIHTIISKSPIANSKYIYKKIEENLENEDKAFLIVPEQYTLQTDTNLMDNIGFKTVMDAKVLSFSSFIRYVIDKLGSLSFESLSKNGKVMLVSSILYDINHDLRLFNNNYQNIDFVNDMVSLISTIKDNQFDDEFFKKVEDEVSDENLRLKFRESKLIFDAYQKQINESYLDTEDMLYEVMDMLSECDFIKGSYFYFDKFDYVSDSKLDFINELQRLGAHVYVSLTLDKDVFSNPWAKDIDIYDMTYKFYNNLKNISDGNILDEINIDIPINPNEDINHLCLNFEKYNPDIFTKETPNIHILESTSTKKEVENIGLLINRLIYEQNLRYRDIAIYISDSDEYENEIKKVFDRYQIPVFMNKTRKLVDNHIVKSMLAALRLVIYNFNINDLNYFLRSNVFDFSEDSFDKIIAFQNYVNSRKIKGSMFLDDKYFTMDRMYYENIYGDDEQGKRKFQLKEKEFDDINYIRNIILDLLDDLIDIREDKLKTIDIVTAIYKTLSSNRFTTGINNYQEVLFENGNLDLHLENDQVWDKFMVILEDMANLMGDRKQSLREIYKIIETCAADMEIGIIPPTKDHVIVTNFKMPRVSERKINIAMGLNDVFFPSKSRSDFLIGKDDNIKLRELGLDLKIYEEDLEEREKLNFYKMMTISDKLYLSFALSDRTGAKINESIVLSQIKLMFTKLSITDLTTINQKDFIYSKEMSQRFTLDTLWKVKRGERYDQGDLDFAKTYIAYLKCHDKDDLILKGINYTNNNKALDVNISNAMFKKNDYSVSQIETYSKCPYKHYVNYGLRPAIDDSYDVEVMELGNIVHSSLERVSSLLKDIDINEVTNEDLSKIITENFNKSVSLNLDKPRREDPRNKFILDNMHKNTIANSNQVLKQISDGMFNVADVELEFGYDEEGNFPRVYVDDDNYLKGRIDRLDSYENYVRVIDYKTGNKFFKLVNILNGLDLQLIVYMLSISDSDKNLIPIGSFYMPLADELQSFKETYNEENLEKIIDEKFKLNGLIINTDNPDIPVKIISKDADTFEDIKTLDLKNSEILTEEEKDELYIIVRKQISDDIKKIKHGDISLHPIQYDKDRYECQYCEFKGICKFDETIDSDKLREIDKDRNIKSEMKRLEGLDG